MNILDPIARWLDIRPHEVRSVALSFLGAFLVLAFLVLARSLREALYLTTYDVETLPYIMAAVALLSVPTVGLFSRLLARRSPRKVLRELLVIMGLGLVVLWPFATRVGLAVIAFYLWTALGTLLLTSGFWVVTSEHFPVRGAKRLFGLIGAGGTAGAMVMGTLLPWFTRFFDVIWLVPALIVLLVVFFTAQSLMPRLEPSEGQEPGASRSGSSMRESLGLAWRDPHLRTIALVVATTALASTVLDYQFKEYARADLTTNADLTGFFGAFYGWTGAVALILQLLVAARLMGSAGIGVTLSILPIALFLGSTGFLVAPSLALVTAVRGADNSLRKSLHRSVIEVLYVPVPSMLRRKTKTFVDSVVDAVAEGAGAAVVFFWVTLNGLPSRHLSALIVVLAAYVLYLSQRMNRRYFQTVTRRLTEQAPAGRPAGGPLEGRDLLSGSFTRLDVSSVLEAVDEGEGEFEPPGGEAPTPAPTAADRSELLRSGDLRTVVETLDRTDEWRQEDIPDLVRLLARDPLYERVIRLLTRLPDELVVPALAEAIRDDGTDFVIRRRIPKVLARAGGAEADDALVEALQAPRFEVRYRAALALVRRRRNGLPRSTKPWQPRVWEAIRTEVGRERPVWELQRLLDGVEAEDEFVTHRVDARGQLSLEHTFRLLSLVLDAEPVRAAFHGIVADDDRLRSFSLEYLEQVLPADIRRRLWPFIGDVSDHERKRSIRSLDRVVSDLLTTDATLFGEADHRAALKRILNEEDE